ncbi:DUF192 domain-containing protein [Chitinophaga deserti]|uniref:DUF192 domain-containing protein n=1 Tax=Chitinophaga deserti TaxID=2164099 RepID=UPI0018E58376|nr:DUF192 domain-containing protein [Chitinophaga deserti]
MKQLNLVLALTGAMYLAACQPKSGQQNQDASAGGDTAATSVTTPTPKADGPVFTKEGVLSFISKAKGDTIRTIDIELAQTDEERALGLMNRKSMEDTQGMLFIFESAQEQSFWMKNTYISLDIMYVDANKEIVSIRKYTTPLSEDGVPSLKPAQYVVETIAGFSDKFHVQVGDKIDFTIQK